MVVTGPEGLRIVVDSDYGMYRRFLALFAECFAIDIAFGNGERPAVLVGQHVRLFLERDYRHDTSVWKHSHRYFVGMINYRCLQPSVFCVVLSARALPLKPRNRNQYPGVARRRRVGVAGRIGGAYLEAVAAVGQAAIALGTHAGCEGTRIELAGKGAAGLGGGEAEAGAAAGAAGRRRGRDARVRRRGVASGRESEHA